MIVAININDLFKISLIHFFLFISPSPIAILSPIGKAINKIKISIIFIIYDAKNQIIIMQPVNDAPICTKKLTLVDKTTILDSVREKFGALTSLK